MPSTAGNFKGSCNDAGMGCPIPPPVGHKPLDPLQLNLTGIRRETGPWATRMTRLSMFRKAHRSPPPTKCRMIRSDTWTMSAPRSLK